MQCPFSMAIVSGARECMGNVCMLYIDDCCGLYRVVEIMVSPVKASDPADKSKSEDTPYVIRKKGHK